MPVPPLETVPELLRDVPVGTRITIHYVVDSVRAGDGRHPYYTFYEKTGPNAWQSYRMDNDVITHRAGTNYVARDFTHYKYGVLRWGAEDATS